MHVFDDRDMYDERRWAELLATSLAVSAESAQTTLHDIISAVEHASHDFLCDQASIQWKEHFPFLFDESRSEVYLRTFAVWTEHLVAKQDQKSLKLLEVINKRIIGET